MSRLERDWTEAERLWRGAGGMDDRLAMVERALAALSGQDDEQHSKKPASRGSQGGRNEIG